MKRQALISIAAALCASSFTYADTLNVSSGWQLLGGTSNGISDMSVFDTPAGCVKTIFAYRAGAYLSYAPGGTKQLASLMANEGYWLNGGGSCTITTDAVAAAAPAGATPPPAAPVAASGFTQTDIDNAKLQAKTEQTAACRADPTSCGIVIAAASGFTQTDIDDAKLQAKTEQTAACKADPASCGIVVAAAAAAAPAAAATFRKPSQGACEAGRGVWGVGGHDECFATYKDAVNICKMPSKDDWLTMYAGCGADTSVSKIADATGANKISDDTKAGVSDCVDAKGLGSYKYYWSSTTYDSYSNWISYYDRYNTWSVYSNSNQMQLIVRCAD